MEKLLEVKNLGVSFNTYMGKVEAVRGVNFDVMDGTTVAIVGESGSGKTVTAKAIMGLIERPFSELKAGTSILFQGREITQMKERDLEQYRGFHVGMIFQDAMTALNPTMTIGDQITENLVVHRRIAKKDAFKKAIEMLEMVHIANPMNRAKQYPHELSGGMRQRVMIAIALACNPKLLIADEPTTALDVTIQLQIINLLKELQEKMNTSIILITHDFGIVAEMAKEVIVMYAGQIVECGGVEEIFYNPQHPYTWALLNSIPRIDQKSSQRLVSIKGTPPDLMKPPRGCAFASRCKYCMLICKEEAPQMTEVSKSHHTYCWLKHPFAPKVLGSDLI